MGDDAVQAAPGAAAVRQAGRRRRRRGGEAAAGVCDQAGDMMQAVMVVQGVLTLYFALGSAVSLAVRKPYMDEIFHVRQAQTYCEERYLEWDPKITTLPGLYAYAVGLARAAEAMTGLGMRLLCSAPLLRVYGAVLGIAVYAVLRALVNDLHADRPAAWRNLKAAELALFPVLFFFNFLFYTDVGSTLFVLSMLLSAGRGQHAAASLAGLLAVAFRQSNAVWVLFCAATEAVRLYETGQLTTGGDATSEDGAGRDTLRPTRLEHVPRAVRAAVPAVLRRLPRVLLAVAPYLAVLGLFAAFVRWNGGIVVGDKSNHEAVFHLAQVLYFALFAALFMGLSAVSPAALRARLAEARAHPAAAAALLAAAAAAVHFCTYVHPFLLADNRHFAFYVRRYLGRFRYAAVPAYVFGLAAVRAAFGARRSWLWMLCYWACTAAVLAASPLVEPRYFIVPFLVAQLHQRAPSTRQLAVNVAGALLVNGVVFYVFLMRPFQWGDGSTARFMW